MVATLFRREEAARFNSYFKLRAHRQLVAMRWPVKSRNSSLIAVLASSPAHGVHANSVRALPARTCVVMVGTPLDAESMPKSCSMAECVMDADIDDRSFDCP